MIARIGIISGVAEEAAVFMPDARSIIEQHGDLEVRKLQLHGKEIVITFGGIGKVNAATAATVLAMRYDVDLLMIIGTAGRLRNVPGDCFLLSEAVQGDYGARRSDGFVHYTAGTIPIGEPTLDAFFPYAATPDIGLPHARIVTGDCFVECPDHSLRLRDNLKGDLVDMETGALAQAALRLNLPWIGIKAPTDDANGESAGDFRTNLLRAARLAADAAERLIAKLD